MAGEIILDPFSFATVPIEMYFRQQKLSIGTAFNWQAENGANFLVTNWHNVAGMDPNTGKNLSSHGGRPDRLVAYFVKKDQIGEKIAVDIPLWEHGDDDKPLWKKHPTLGRAVDAVAIPMPEQTTVDWFAINTLESKRRLSADVGQDVFILGYPFGTGAHGFPVWKRASIASEPKLILPSLQHMLVDSASRPGMSGSPVIRRSWGSHSLEGGGVVMGPQSMTTFIGIYSGRLHTTDQLDAQLGLVWRASLIAEIVAGGTRNAI